MVSSFGQLGVVSGRGPHKPKIGMKFPAALLMKFPAVLLHTYSQTLGSLLSNTGLGMEVNKLEGVIFKDTRETQDITQ
jgi:hypothetical protein